MNSEGESIEGGWTLSGLVWQLIHPLIKPFSFGASAQTDSNGKNSQQLQQQQQHWCAQFGDRVQPLILHSKTLQREWREDRALCPISIKQKYHRPHWVALANTHGKDRHPLEVVPLQQHHSSSSCVHLIPSDHDLELFCLTVVHNNDVWYIGDKGLTEDPQFVRVWLWNVHTRNNNRQKKSHSNKITTKHHQNQKQGQWILITDESDQWILQVENLGSNNNSSNDSGGNDSVILKFETDIPDNIFNAVFLSADYHRFVDFYQN